MPESTKVSPSPLPTVSSRAIAVADSIKDRKAELLASRQIQPGQDDFLFALLESDGITMGALAERLNISPSSATKAAIKLEAAGLIHREASRVDSRQNYAHLTPAGRDLAREIFAEFEALDTEIFSALKPKDLERLIKIFDRLENPQKASGKKPKKAGSAKKKSKKGKKATA